MKKIICLIFSLLIFVSLISCGDDSELKYSSYGPYDPYYNNYKEDVPTGRKISVEGKTFYFENGKEDMMVRDENGIWQDTEALTLGKLYTNIRVIFTAEDTVMFKDDTNAVFNVPETKGVREGNVLTIKRTNSDGYTYDVRIEIHKEKIIVIHNGHTYDTPGTYSTITFYE
jgi:hypothetical protein